MLKALGFPAAFVARIMTCVCLAKFSISLNGECFRFFPSERGLRQGDPMSPLPFVIIVEYLSRSIKVAIKCHSFKFHPLCKRVNPAHLSIADDLLLFCKAIVDSVTCLMGASQHFSQCSGLVENASKSQIVMAIVDRRTQARIMEITGFTKGDMPFKYLGIPIKSSRLTKDDCK